MNQVGPTTSEPQANGSAPVLDHDTQILESELIDKLLHDGRVFAGGESIARFGRAEAKTRIV